LLWIGNIDAAILCFEGWSDPTVDNFIAYLKKHQHRIINYDYLGLAEKVKKQGEGINL
jgi:hypothetical protein